MKSRVAYVPILLIGILVLASCKTSRVAASKSKSETKSHAETSQKLVAKYSAILGVSPSKVKNIELYKFIDNWYGTPYQYGGQSTSGVDCSGFVQTLYKEVYSKSIPRTTSQIRSDMKTVSKSKLREGALVFFDIDGKKGSHVGVYLQNGNFVHASTSKGVIISSLSNPYYVKSFGKAGIY